VSALAGRRVRIAGIVQGVGFRPFVHRIACDEGVTGSVRNDAGGVVVDAWGGPAALARLRSRIEREAPRAARIREISEAPLAGAAPSGFSIVASASDAERRVSIPPDVAPCDACLAELADPSDRRQGYAFVNCVACGPRYTIAFDVPWDRRATTMAAFAMCQACRREYEDPHDRRFHAEPNACPACGPRLAWLDAEGRCVETDDPLAAAARALAAGRILAVRGVGGFHLACDASDSEAVKRLRERKRREAKPFAVMVADLGAARALAHVSGEEARLLASPERPIVLLRARTEAGVIAPEVAPGLPWLGLLLPSTPLHVRLLAAVRRPLVMTSGNLADEPIASANREATARLAGVADAFLVHDREIANRCDDSVARVVAGAPLVLRRARGYVPRPIELPEALPEPVLACGAQLKNTVCLGVGSLAVLGPHVGDLDDAASYDAFCEGIERLERFVGVRADVVAHDLHPDYLSTRYAQERAARRRIAVQHHHAHVASALAEHGLEGPALGLAWDGSGFGGDGSAWGGELLCVDGARCERLATFRPIALAGGERAIREPWRAALALVTDAFDGAPPLAALALFARVAPERLDAVRALLRDPSHTLPAHGVGRYFDALAALVLERPLARYEGELALLWNGCADPVERRPYGFALRQPSGRPLEIDPRAMVRAAVADHAAGVPAATIAGRFHETLACAAATLVERADAARGERLPLALTGGCFQNALLAERVCARLGGDRRVLRHGAVPPGDGGLALGQAVVAAAMLRKGGVACA
jgi:hydrogenase maturation protein HypF